jgi:hypothetical protein
MQVRGRLTHPLLPAIVLAPAAVAVLTVSRWTPTLAAAAWVTLGLAAGYSISGSV